ncbi:MAG TPA: hypothetical protein VK474_11305 [Chthoniobacterales bacterium]|nr:hypothetical protein [Chthoniobacterales bacterium]
MRLSAAKAGVAYQTVFKHQMKDEAFADAWDRALQQGYVRLEARLLEEAHTPHPSACDGSLPLPQAGEGLEEEERFDPQLALAILREQKRNVHGHSPKRSGRRRGRRPTRRSPTRWRRG